MRCAASSRERTAASPRPSRALTASLSLQVSVNVVVGISTRREVRMGTTSERLEATALHLAFTPPIHRVFSGGS